MKVAAAVTDSESRVNSVASASSGRLGGLYETLSPSQFWLLHAALVGVGWAAFLALCPWLRRALRV